MTSLRQGQIIWTPVRDPFGNPPANHPVIIISSDDDNKTHDTVVGVVASHTSAMMKPRPDGCIALPFHPNGNCLTGFRKETVAVCKWIVSIPSDGHEIRGEVPKRVLIEIMKQIEEIRQASIKAKASAKVAPPAFDEPNQ